MRRLCTVVAIGALATLLATPAPAGALDRIRIPLGAGEFDIVGYCPFTVHARDVVQREVETDTLDANGNLVRIDIHGDLVDELTNVVTGKRVTLNNSGPVTITFGADGSVTAVQRGQAITGDRGVLTGHPFLIHQTGRLVTTGVPDPVTGSINVVSQTRSGRTEDLCALLA